MYCVIKVNDNVKFISHMFLVGDPSLLKLLLTKTTIPGYFLCQPVPGELATMPPLVSDKARDNETSSDSCLDQ
jgi:hypothetical protein